MPLEKFFFPWTYKRSYFFFLFFFSLSAVFISRGKFGYVLSRHNVSSSQFTRILKYGGNNAVILDRECNQRADMLLLPHFVRPEVK